MFSFVVLSRLGIYYLCQLAEEFSPAFTVSIYLQLKDTVSGFPVFPGSATNNVNALMLLVGCTAMLLFSVSGRTSGL